MRIGNPARRAGGILHAAFAKKFTAEERAAEERQAEERQAEGLAAEKSTAEALAAEKSAAEERASEVRQGEDPARHGDGAPDAIRDAIREDIRDGENGQAGDAEWETERAIIELFLARCEDAIAYAEKKYGRLIYGIALRILNDPGDSEECRNAVYGKLWDTIPPEEPRSLRAYIIRLTRNAALDRLRYETRRKRIRSDFTASLDDLSEVLTDDYSVEEEIDARELTRALDRFLGALSEERRCVFVKRYYYGETVAAISAETGMKPGKINRILQTEKEHLRTYLTEKGFLES